MVEKLSVQPCLDEVRNSTGTGGTRMWAGDWQDPGARECGRHFVPSLVAVGRLDGDRQRRRNVVQALIEFDGMDGRRGGCLTARVSEEASVLIERLVRLDGAEATHTDSETEGYAWSEFSAQVGRVGLPRSRIPRMGNSVGVIRFAESKLLIVHAGVTTTPRDYSSDVRCGRIDAFEPGYQPAATWPEPQAREIP